MIIPDIGGILHISVPDLGIEKYLPCKDLQDAYTQLKQFKAQMQKGPHEVIAIYQPISFELGRDDGNN